MTGRRQTWRIAVRLLAAFALVFLSFAHKPALAKGPSRAIAADYLLPDGTFADICFGAQGVDHDHDKPSSGPRVCEACRLAGSVLLPMPPEESEPAENGNWLAQAPIEEAAATLAPLRLLPPSRGPPRLS
ncbi:hypothetical protein PYH37_004116 [Sinorhizobium numidicum]|uniref:DUF2946 domain-containing protein n=1 Tax=Sinorhizobium numidicum TaxID=680248 RepID=A0ABY8CVA8_9HYPH|nr:hypothetical protein [Sinorhizobium numidicum]WEX75865.1 hypothetical protein PYH37_004116 [Sinorhizobium numidicum]WEX82524.1 hypothetical protein PYH38_004828 [Sinorhizobium numidicum]